MKKINEIEDLIECFFEGTTSVHEEKELYDFFCQNEIPEHLRKYKPIFQYFDQVIVNELSKNENIKVIQPRKGILKNRKHIVYIVSSIAASFLLIITGYYLINKNSTEFDPYEGSYIVRNGARITDMDIIRPELEKVYQEVIQERAKAECEVDNSLNQCKISYNIERQVKEDYDDLLDQVTDDDYSKKEIKKIFESI